VHAQATQTGRRKEPTDGVKMMIQMKTSLSVKKKISRTAVTLPTEIS
jgi:hypothetical protein